MPSLRLALRALFKSPFVTIVAVLSLALGIGANAAIFSLFNEVLLRALPVPHPERLVYLAAPGPTQGSHSDDVEGPHDAIFSYPMYRDLERLQTVFTGLAAHRLFGANMAFHGATLNGDGLYVSGSYFATLEITPAVGRLISPADDRVVGGGPVAVVSYNFWRDHLGADARVVGDRILVNGQPMTVIGVAPQGFDGTNLGAAPDVYVPISMRPALDPLFHGVADRTNYWAYVFGRLKPGVTMTQASVAMNAVFHPIITDVEAPQQKDLSAGTMARFKARSLVVRDGKRGSSMLRDDRRASLYLLLGITAVVLLIACANIANLLLARGANRATEMAVRLSLGASRTHLVAQLLTESCVLALMGGVASLLVARTTLGLLGALLPSHEGAILHFQLDSTALLFTAALSVGTGILFGVFPALHATSPDLVTTLREGVGKHSGSRGAARFRSSLVTAQIALSTALLICAGLFVQSLRNLGKVDLGMDITNVVAFHLSPGRNGYGWQRSREELQRVEDQLRALPGVSEVPSSLVPLLTGTNWDNSVNVEGFRRDPDTDTDAYFDEVGPGYFAAMHIPLVSGREFTAADVFGSPKVAVVNEAFAKKFGLGRDAVGKFMSQGPMGKKLDMQIVGVVKNTKYSGLRNEERPIYVTAFRQDTTFTWVTYYARATSSPDALVHEIPALVSRVDPNVPVQDLTTMEAQVRENISLDRLVSALSASFASLATLLAAIGLYGVLAYSVAQRTREIGVRMALGADAGRVRRLVFRQVGVMVLVGGVVGIAAALLIGRSAGSLLYQLKAYDPLITAVAATLLAVVSFAAGYLPARKASRVDPMQALRYE